MLTITNERNLVYCPITKQIMRHPVLLHDGRHYELQAIVSWLQRTCSPYHLWRYQPIRIGYDQHLKKTLDDNNAAYDEHDRYPDYDKAYYLRVAQLYCKHRPGSSSPEWLKLRSLFSGGVYTASLAATYAALARIFFNTNVVVPVPAVVTLTAVLTCMDLAARIYTDDIYNLFELAITRLHKRSPPVRHARDVQTPHDAVIPLRQTPLRLALDDDLWSCPVSLTPFRHPVLYGGVHYELKTLADYLRIGYSNRLLDGRLLASDAVIDDGDLKAALDNVAPGTAALEDRPLVYDVDAARAIIAAHTSKQRVLKNSISTREAFKYAVSIPMLFILASVTFQMMEFDEDFARSAGLLVALTLVLSEYALKLTDHDVSLRSIYSFFSGTRDRRVGAPLGVEAIPEPAGLFVPQ